MEQNVPRILIISGGRAISDAAVPRHIADTCACWPDGEINKAKRLIRTRDVVTCQDATAYAALTSLSLAMLMSGQTVKAKIEKGWAGADRS